MEGFTLENFNKLKPYSILTAQFNSSLSDESDQDASTTTADLRIIIQFILTKYMIAPLLITMWDHMDGCAKQYLVHQPFIYYNLFIYNFLLLLIDHWEHLYTEKMWLVV